MNSYSQLKAKLLQKPIELLWIDLQPSLKPFSKRLSCELATINHIVRRWEFHQEPDEYCTTQLIESYLLEELRKNKDEKPVLIGHGISGLFASNFAAKHPDLVDGLILISVDTKTSNYWFSHYYQMRNLYENLERQQVINHLVPMLLGSDNRVDHQKISGLFLNTLDKEYCKGSVLKPINMESIQIPQNLPVLVLVGDKDFVVDRQSEQRWQNLLKSGDRFAFIEDGYHFPQLFKSRQCASEIERFLMMTCNLSIPNTLTLLAG
ncbi:alpha/beta fold hydrolase [Synechococcus sp. UW105]|uniref:alpha/beta fold hydrolase n=1 Tax=Synechococcus sp. UW105 TaxID=337067 RepID=UPI001A7E04E7|nr:alpha/beta hydrolase [Synechococcus sp. UW105]